ncbi:hypothetical protein LJC48_02955 [Desulfovibrio sp. OttesenSCG-928-C06]|nr:hypothetical protein [Desulfovibrio sp. OttesenSCG-928-C06]
MGRTALAVLFLFAALSLCACSSRVSTDDIRSDLAADHLAALTEKFEEAHIEHHELVTALNWARALQLQGRWQESITAYNYGIEILEEYENRAIINMRGILQTTGSILLTRGSEEYFGTGYERSLLHTMNAMNYMMLGDFEGAAVEMRRMEIRQEMWLAEEAQRLQQFLEENKGNYDGDLSSLPSGYSMASVLNSPEVRAVAAGYQDPFSYALSAITCRLAEDYQYAGVSLRRAALLNENARELFTRAWNLDDKGKARNEEWHPRIPQLPPANHALAAGSSGTAQGDSTATATASPARTTQTTANTRGKAQKDGQEVVIIVMSGLAPAMHMEQVRIPAPYIGYLMIDLPSYVSAVRPSLPGIEFSGLAATTGTGKSAGRAASATSAASAASATSGGTAHSESPRPYQLLNTELLAYRVLRDEVRYEIGSAISRALVRAAVSGGAYAIAKSHEDTEAFAPLIGLVANVIMDVFATTTSQSVRNWEMLPAAGYLCMGSVERGGSVRIALGHRESEVTLPPEARGVVIFVSQTTNATMRVDYVTY